VTRRVKGGWPQDPVRPAIELILKIARNDATSTKDAHKGAVRDLLVLGAVDVTGTGSLFLRDPSLVTADKVVPEKLRALMNAVPGVAEGLAVLQQEPTARPETVGTAVKEALAADWAAGTTHGVGKNLRGWARYAGINVQRVPRVAKGAVAGVPVNASPDEGEVVTRSDAVGNDLPV